MCTFVYFGFRGELSLFPREISSLDRAAARSV